MRIILQDICSSKGFIGVIAKLFTCDYQLKIKFQLLLQVVIRLQSIKANSVYLASLEVPYCYTYAYFFIFFSNCSSFLKVISTFFFFFCRMLLLSMTESLMFTPQLNQLPLMEKLTRLT